MAKNKTEARIQLNFVQLNFVCYYSKFQSVQLIKKKQHKIQLYGCMYLLSSYKFSEIQLITIDLASPEKIKEWAEKKLPNGKIFGQVTNPNTLHYKTLKPLKGGLFCERIFGPIKDFECACGIHKQKPFNRIISFQNKQFCPKCDIEYTWSDIRRYQLGYIELVTPITHLWYLKGIPSYIRSVLGAKKKHIEAIAYCSEIVTIDKAWKPNRFIPFPETNSSVTMNSKKTFVNTYNCINSNNFKHSNNRKIKYLNKKFLQQKFSNKIIERNEIRTSLFFSKYFNINFIKPKNFKEIKCFNRNPYFSKIENSSYKNKVYFYQQICRSFIKTSLKNNKPIYALNFLYRSFLNSKVSLKIFNNFYTIDNIMSLFNDEVLMIRFNNLYIFKKSKNYNKIFSCIYYKKIFININKNFLYFKNIKLKNLQLFKNSQLITRTKFNCIDSLNYLKNCSKKNYLTLKIQFLNKKLSFGNYNIFFNTFTLLYFNIFSFHYFKNSNFFVKFSKLLTFNIIKYSKYNFFNIFIIPIPTIIDNLIFKLSLDSQFQILFNLISIKKQKVLNSDLVILKSYKILKKEFLINNLSIYEEANEIIWQKFWKVCYFFTYKKINQKLRKIIKKFNKPARRIPSTLLSVLKLIKNLINKTKFNCIDNQYTLNCIDDVNKKNRNPNKKLSLFVNVLKIYLKKYYLFIK